MVLAWSIAVATSCIVLSSLLYLLLRHAGMIATSSRPALIGALPVDVANEPPASDLVPACLEAADRTAMSFEHSETYLGFANKCYQPIPGPRTIVPATSCSLQRNINSNGRTPPTGPVRRRRQPQSPPGSSTTAGPSREAPSPPSRDAPLPPSREAPPPPTEPRQAESSSKDNTPRISGTNDYQVGDNEQTPWNEYEIPDELAILQPGEHEEIRHIVQESMDAQRAMRLSTLQAAAVVVKATVVMGWREWEIEEPPMGPESSVMASRRQAVSSTSSLGTASVDQSLSSRTSLGSSDAAYDVLKPTAPGQGSPLRSSGTSYLPDLNPTNRRTQKSRAKVSRLFGMFRRSEDAISSTHTELEPTTSGRESATSKQEPATSEQEPATYECTSCFDDIPNNEAIKVPCQHRYCRPCFSQLIATAIQNEDQFPPKCCLQEIPRVVFQPHLPAEELASFDSKALEYSVAVDSRYYCPRPACARWIDTTKTRRHHGSLVCTHCRYRMCTICRGPAHAGGRDCPQDFDLDATLQQAEREGWPRCYKCRALVELNTGCRHITCKCKAEFCYTCGARWKTCACTEKDQARRMRTIRANLEQQDAAAQVEAEEIRAAIAAVELSEQQAEEARMEEERRQEQLRALHEAERVDRISRHFNRLRDILMVVQLAQSDALAARHGREVERMEEKKRALEASTAARLSAVEKAEQREKARIVNATETKIEALGQKHAAQLMETRSRHRRDEDACFAQLAERDFMTSGLWQATQAGDAATVLDTLLVAQGQERAALREAQGWEVEKRKENGAVELGLFEERVGKQEERRR
ncbi:MAG: hypothetical protein LQ341_004073, partial [Variospora aurantia]